jgi:hypothetical protein
MTDNTNIKKAENNRASSSFINLSTFGDFEKEIIKPEYNLENFNNLYNELNINFKHWISYRNYNIYNFTKESFKDDELSVTCLFSGYADLSLTQSLYFENCDESILDSICFFINDLPVETISRQWIDIYNQMYSQIKHQNTLIIPSYHYRHNLFMYLGCPNNKHFIKIKLKRKLKDNESIKLYAKQGVVTNELREKMNKDIKYKFYYDRFIQANHTNSKDIDIRVSDPISEIFISVKKLDNYPTGKDTIKTITLGFEMCVVHDAEPASFFKVINPVMQGLNPAEENDEYQSHYLISFSETSKPFDKNWRYRTSTNFSSLTNVWLRLELDESIPKESYIFEVGCVKHSKLIGCEI